MSYVVMGPLGLSGRRPAQHDYLPSGRAWASLGDHGSARHDPLANPGRADTVPIRVEPSRDRAGLAQLAHLDIYRLNIKVYIM
jgi:hypothetical protein